MESNSIQKNVFDVSKNVTPKDIVKTEKGNPYRLGASLTESGCNFAVFSRHATDVYLLLYDDYKDALPSKVIKFDEKTNRTGDIWHIFVYGIKHGQHYGYAVDGPYWPLKSGHRFNVNKLIIDPYSKAVSGNYHWNKYDSFGYELTSRHGDISFNENNNYDSEVKSIVVDDSKFNWEGDKQLNIPLKDSIIYELHTRAFTKDKSSSVKHPGTYLGIIEKIPHFKELGITAVELLPVQEFNEDEVYNTNPVTKTKLVNFWGYSTLAFFAPDSWYSTDGCGLNAVEEFKTMVKELHKAGIEIILDVVYNHTGEGNEKGPTLSFRGLDNSIYYMLENGRYYKNHSGCGNTFNCNHPVVKRLILDSLRYWVVDMHIDGFRFDLATILGRDPNGYWIPEHSLLADIANDPILANTKIISESWDAGGLYKVGQFPFGWAEWNGKFRDDVRSFIKGACGASEFSKRIGGSQDLFHSTEKYPYHSINYVSCHDGFCLNDLVSYNDKHNEQNGENNHDGDNNNSSWNCGVEGESGATEKIVELRNRQMKNLFSIVLISLGTPMILAGDEIKFSKKGNNNTYCQDNDYNWIDWNLLAENREFFEFCKYMIKFRKRHPILRRSRFFTGVDSGGNNIPDISWHGLELNKPEWEKNHSYLAFMMNGSLVESTGQNYNDNNIYVAVNSSGEDLSFNAPAPRKHRMWHQCVNTALKPGFFEQGSEPRIKSPIIQVKSRSLVILIDKGR